MNEYKYEYYLQKNIVYEYLYEYYSWHLVSQLCIRIFFVKNYSQTYSNPRVLPPTSLKIMDKISKLFCNYQHFYINKNSSFFFCLLCLVNLDCSKSYFSWPNTNMDNIHIPSLLQIRIWIIFIIFLTVNTEYEYYLYGIFTNIFEYSNIWH